MRYQGDINDVYSQKPLISAQGNYENEEGRNASIFDSFD